MISNQIKDRIIDLLKLSGVTDNQTLEELTDHYLSHIETEVNRGVNLQQTIRDTYQEIAQLDTTQLKKTKKSNHYKYILFFGFLILGMVVFILNKNDIDLSSQLVSTETLSASPPTGYPIHQSDFEIYSEFGMIKHPLMNKKMQHQGIDIRADIGTTVLSTGYGKIIESGFSKKAGNFIVIKHNEVYSTKYFHLSEIFVQDNEIVEEGQIIASVGNTGMSSMPHLHYEIVKDGVPINPRPFVEP